MPINIYDANTFETIAKIGEDSWELPQLLDDLEKWVEDNTNKLPNSSYIADIGFDIRPNAFAGGGTLSANTLKKLSEMNLDIHFSEYPGVNTKVI